MGNYDEKTNTTVYRVPLDVNEVILSNAEDDGHTIYINEDLTDEEARRAFDHALGHVRRNDFEKTDVQQIEAEAHRIKAEEPPKKKAPALRQKKKKRKFTAMELELLRRDPFLQELLEIPESEIPRKSNAAGMSKERFAEIHELMKEQHKRK